jgi:hypothetical protein
LSALPWRLAPNLLKARGDAAGGRLGNESDPGEPGTLHGVDRTADAPVRGVNIPTNMCLGHILFIDVFDPADRLDLTALSTSCWLLTLVRFQYTPQVPSGSPLTDRLTFSGLVVVGRKRTLGSLTGTVCNTTGTVIRKMINNTSITSTSGVVLMSDMGTSSPSSAGPTLIDILSWPSL